MNLWRLFQIEFYKQKHNRSIVLLFLGIIAFLFVSILNIPNIHVNDLMRVDFPLWSWTTGLAEIATYPLSLIVIFMISGEYTYRTLKQNLIDGLSKTQWIASKVFMIFAIAFFITLVVFFTTLYLSFSYSIDSSWMVLSKDVVFYTLSCFLSMFFFFCMVLFFTILCKRSIFSVAIIFAWFLIEKNLTYFYDFENLKDFLPFHVMENLIHSPFSEIKLDVFKVLIAFFWIVFFIFGSYFILKKRDL